MTPTRREVLVIGGGPAGAATGHWLAKAGHDVLVVERKRFPRDKTCGDGLTPRAVRQIQDMGLEAQVAEHHRYEGLRALAHGLTLELAWPQHPDFPPYGYVIRRRDLDQLVAERAADLGAEVRQGSEAIAPIHDGGFLTGAVVRDVTSGVAEEVEARYVVIADGANSRFGRALGTSRNRRMPQGMAIRGYYESPRHDDPFIESSLDLRDRNGNSLPGYGWIFPVGDGTVNVGVGLLSTFRDYTSINTSTLLEAYSQTAPESWGLGPDSKASEPTGGRLPMAGSVGPRSGPNWLVVGDAGGSVNPFNGEGIDYAYETGRLAADVVHEALVTDSGLALVRYGETLDREYGLYFKVARLFAQVIGRPALMRELTRVGMRSRSLMEWVLRIMANLLRPDELGPAEAAYKAAAALARIIPEPGARTSA